MGKKSDKIDAAKAKLKELKRPKNAKSAVEEVPPLPAAKAAKAPKVGKDKGGKEKTKSAAAMADPTFDEIQVEAYHMAQKRIAQGVAGTSAEDWVAAERSLRKARGL